MPMNCWLLTATAATVRAPSPPNWARPCCWITVKVRGHALRVGIAHASGDVLVFIDADGSHDPRDIPALVQPIVDGNADHVSGSRMLGGSDELHATINQFVRLFGSQVITLSINYSQDVRLTDSQNGFRAIRVDVARGLALESENTTIEQGDDHKNRAQRVSYL